MKLQASAAVQPTPIQLVPYPEGYVSRNDKGDNEMIPKAVQRSLGICLTAVENMGKPSDERAMWPVFASNGIPSFQMRSVGLHCTSGREREGEGKDGGGNEVIRMISV